MNSKGKPGTAASAWAWVVAWSLLIFATIPLARTLQKAIRENFGKETFLAIVLICVAIATLALLRSLWRRRRMSVARLLTVIGVAMAYGIYSLALASNPEEALHFVEYAALGVFCHRAWRYHCQSPLVYLLAALTGGLVGIMDEGIQWATPSRVWDLRDIGINLVGASLIQIAIAADRDQPLRFNDIKPKDIRLLVSTLLVFSLLLGMSLMNTPDNSRWLRANLPFGQQIIAEGKVMVEYGHLYASPGLNQFRSRLGPDELANTDQQRAVEVGALLRDSIDKDYGKFLIRYSPTSDPFAHEARVHLFSRDRNLSKGYDETTKQIIDLDRLSIAWRENLILEGWFPETLKASGLQWAPSLSEFAQTNQDPDYWHDSAVSQHLFTHISKSKLRAIIISIWLSLAGILIFLFWLEKKKA